MLEPAAISATAKALADREASETARLKAFELAVERPRYEAERARRQFDACEPENRLVARTLETNWEGGASTQLAPLKLRRQGQSYRATDEDTVELVRRLAALLRELVLDLKQPVHRPVARVLINLLQTVDPRAL